MSGRRSCLRLPNISAAPGKLSPTPKARVHNIVEARHRGKTHSRAPPPYPRPSPRPILSASSTGRQPEQLSCPLCCSAPALIKLQKLANHPSLLQVNAAAAEANLYRVHD